MQNMDPLMLSTTDFTLPSQVLRQKVATKTTHEDILDNLRNQIVKEVQYSPDCEYLTTVQKDGMISSWRQKIVQWMINAGLDFNMSLETVACSVNIMDRYLSKVSVTRASLQLLAAVSMHVATKMHETEPITMEELNAVSQGKFSPDYVIEMESQLFSVINWDLNPPTLYSVAQSLVYLLDADSSYKSDLLVKSFAILDLCIKDYTFLQFSVSSCALCAVLIASGGYSNVLIGNQIEYITNQLNWSTQQISLCEQHIFEALLSPDVSKTLSTIVRRNPDLFKGAPRSLNLIEELSLKRSSGDMFSINSAVKRVCVSP